LKVDGPDTLPVEGDAVKTQRIAQNLLLNALKYTARVALRELGDSRQNDAQRWMLCVEDTVQVFMPAPALPWRARGGSN
jgi:signal transduction histidine kinase